MNMPDVVWMLIAGILGIALIGIYERRTGGRMVFYCHWCCKKLKDRRAGPYCNAECERDFLEAAGRR